MNYPLIGQAVNSATWVLLKQFEGNLPRSLRVSCTQGDDLEILCPGCCDIPTADWVADEDVDGVPIANGSTLSFTAHAKPGGGLHRQIWARGTNCVVNVDVDWA